MWVYLIFSKQLFIYKHIDSVIITIMAHNHPSGVTDPSMSDQLLTTALKSALSLVDVSVLDHFVVAGATVSSFAERGLL